MSEWERIKEENAKFQVWWDAEMAPKFERLSKIEKLIAENAAFMAWHKALGLDLARAFEEHIEQFERHVSEAEKRLNERRS